MTKSILIVAAERGLGLALPSSSSTVAGMSWGRLDQAPTWMTSGEWAQPTPIA
ncbi:hypothetical protein [Rhizobium sp.]|uniref:hypothetical protein n=1 Tax=Rhizobium sp. TaxID=391 RepID=UPI0028A025D7